MILALMILLGLTPPLDAQSNNSSEAEDVIVASRPSEIRKSLTIPQRYGHGIKKVALQFPLEAASFYSVVGAYAVYDCTRHFQTKPMACHDFLVSMSEPLTYVSFAAFMMTSHATVETGQLLSESKWLRGSSFLTHNLLWSQLGLMAGSLVSTGMEEILHDPDIRLVATLMRTKRGEKEEKAYVEAWDRLEQKWFTARGLERFSPHLVSVTSSALISAGLQRAGANAVYTRAGNKIVVKEGLLRIPILRGLIKLSQVRFLSGPLNLALFMAIDRALLPTIESTYENFKYHRDYQDLLAQSFKVPLELRAAAEFSKKELHFHQLWRQHVNKKYVMASSDWQRLTSRVLSDVESTGRFYYDLLVARPKLAEHSVGLTLKAINNGHLDWTSAPGFSVNELKLIADGINPDVSTIGQDTQRWTFQNPLILYNEDFGGEARLTGLLYTNWAERLFVHMMCGPSTRSKLFNEGFYGLQLPTFQPPRIFKARLDICHRPIGSMDQKFYYQSKERTLLEILLLESPIETADDFRRWWRPIADEVESMAQKWQKDQAGFADLVLQVWDKPGHARPLQSLALSDYTLPLGLKPSLDQSTNSLLKSLVLVLKKLQGERREVFRTTVIQLKQLLYSDDLELPKKVGTIMDSLDRLGEEEFVNEDDERLVALRTLLDQVSRLANEKAGYLSVIESGKPQIKKVCAPLKPQEAKSQGTKSAENCQPLISGKAQ